MTKTIHLIAAARPNFMKIAPLYHALRKEAWCRPVLIHTGQHYDANMSDDFLRDLGLPEPDHHLNVGSGSHAEQTGKVMIAYEALCREAAPDWTVVAGDVNSTIACALAAVKLGIRVAHLEAGLRSGDRRMPEEINRILTDAISDLLWTPSADGDDNLLREGVAQEKIDRIGNIMIDSYELLRDRIEATQSFEEVGVAPGGYAMLTLHRPSNVDRREDLEALVDALRAVAEKVALVFPAHPRTRQRLLDFGLMKKLKSARDIKVIAPLSYVPFMGLVRCAKMVITDSGGVQEETTYLGIPCLTLRDTTERPVTVSLGTNRLIRRDGLEAAVEAVMAGTWQKGKRPDLWDGQSAQRAVESLRRHTGPAR